MSPGPPQKLRLDPLPRPLEDLLGDQEARATHLIAIGTASLGALGGVVAHRQGRITDQQGEIAVPTLASAARY